MNFVLTKLHNDRSIDFIKNYPHRQITKKILLLNKKINTIFTLSKYSCQDIDFVQSQTCLNVKRLADCSKLIRIYSKI